jgi:hypothetical protein
VTCQTGPILVERAAPSSRRSISRCTRHRLTDHSGRKTHMSVTEIVLWPGTKICELLGVDPEGDAGLIRWMFNTIIYVIVGLSLMWIIMI